MHHVHGGIMPLDAPFSDDSRVHGCNSFTPAYQQLIPSHCAQTPISWSATDHAQLLNEQIGGEPLNFWQAESCLQHSLQYSHAGYSTLGQMEMLSSLNADPYNPSVSYEVSQLVQLYSTLYQDQYGYANLSFVDPVTQPNILHGLSVQSEVTLPTSSDCLQVVSSSGSDSLSTTETWRSETSGGCAPANYENSLTNLNESSSVTLVRDSHDSNFQPHRQHQDVLKQDQAVTLLPFQEPWIYNQSRTDIGRNSLQTSVALSHDSESHEIISVASSSDIPKFKRPRTWDEALRQGSAQNDLARYAVGSKSSLRIDSLQPSSLSRTIPSRHLSFQGKLSSFLLTGASGSSYSQRSCLQEEGRSYNGKPVATSVEPQSVAARHRRKKISERIRVLEKLIPGGNKMDTATMLDEAIEYVKFLQLQVQILESNTLEDRPAIVPTDQILSLQGNMVHGLKRKRNTNLEGDSSTTLSLRAAASPLILSEVLQQQLFKQKLCLVSISQCPPCTTSTPPPIVAPSIRRKN